jgi:hypothetical protein
MAESTPYLLPNTQGRYVTVPVTNISGEVYRINDDGTRTIYADYFVENGNTVLEASTFASQEFQRNVAEGSQGYRQTIGNSIIQASGTTPQQIAAPNPAQQGGSTPITPTQTAVSSGGMMRYPLTMDDGQDKIKFTPLELIKSTFTSGQSIEIKSPSYKALNENIFIGIQGSITDSNGVTWGAGELNVIQKNLVNASLNAMKNGAAGVNQALEEFQSSLYQSGGELSNNLLGLGQLYLAEQAVGVGGLLSRTTGQVLNPNLELLFQGPTLRTFQFQFKMSPRNKNEADTVKRIIKTFKKRMAVKKESTGLFLKAPNVFQIQYLKGESDIHKSLPLIKVCALLNFSVDYTPNGSYMTFGDGQNGDPEASMVTYVLSMAFQEIEPIYDADYDTFNYGTGLQTVPNHPIGA